MIAASALTGRWVARAGPRLPTLLGCLAAGARHAGSPTSPCADSVDYVTLAPTLALAGLGFGVAVVPVTSRRARRRARRPLGHGRRRHHDQPRAGVGGRRGRAGLAGQRPPHGRPHPAGSRASAYRPAFAPSSSTPSRPARCPRVSGGAGGRSEGLRADRGPCGRRRLRRLSHRPVDLARGRRRRDPRLGRWSPGSPSAAGARPPERGSLTRPARPRRARSLGGTRPRAVAPPVRRPPGPAGAPRLLTPPAAADSASSAPAARLLVLEDEVDVEAGGEQPAGARGDGGQLVGAV